MRDRSARGSKRKNDRQHRDRERERLDEGWMEDFVDLMCGGWRIL